MNVLVPELTAAVFFMIVGWLTLWPLREAVGEYTYHLAALPVGLLAASLAGAFATLTQRPLDLLSAIGGASVLVVAAWVVQRVVLGRLPVREHRVRTSSFAAAGGVLLGLGGVLALARLTVSNNDSLVSYWPLGVSLARGSAFSKNLIAARSPLLPSMNGVHATLGSDWAYVIYPLMGAAVAFWLAYTLGAGPFAGVKAKPKRLAVSAVFAFLILEPAFMFHSFFVHSHMVSALYLLVALACLWFGRRSQQPDESSYAAYLVIAGLCTAGLALARPDGLAYQFVPVAAALSVLTATPVRGRSVTAFFGPYLFVLLASYAAAYAELGMWSSSKLSGKTAFAILAVAVLSAAAPWIIGMVDRFVPFDVRGEGFLGLLVGSASVLMVGVFALKWETSGQALGTARINLFEGAGGYSYLWYAVVIIMALTVLSGDALARGSWSRSAFLAIALFFVIAGLVHGVSHVGRIGVGDSFNRIAFEAFPVIVWYAGSVLGRILTHAQDDVPTALGA